MIRSLFVPGASWLHRARPGAKLLALPVAASVLFLSASPPAMAGALLGTLLLYPAAGLAPRLAVAQLRPAMWALVILFAAQSWFAGVEPAATAVLRLAALILLASLVTLTTRVSALVDTLQWALEPLRPLGVDPAKVGLAISLAVRFIPALAAVLEEVREAQRARGVERGALSLAVPMVVRTLKMADEIAEAIDARS